MEKCVCSSIVHKRGICTECENLLKTKRIKNIMAIEKNREEYNRLHGTYKSYGQFVLLLDLIDRRRKEFDNRTKKGCVKKVRKNR